MQLIFMKTSEFDYELDPNRIAQTPVEPRDAARLMVVNRADGSIVHRHLRDIGDYLSTEDLLVFNESRVIPARLFAYKLLPPRPFADPNRLTTRRKGNCVGFGANSE